MVHECVTWCKELSRKLAVKGFASLQMGIPSDLAKSGSIALKEAPLSTNTEQAKFLKNAVVKKTLLRFGSSTFDVGDGFMI
jgi:hypothetical protein